jgi:hypothetical protein
MIRFRCPNCNARMEVDESFAGRPARCATCGVDLKVPAASASDTAITPLEPGGPSGPTTVRIGDETIEVLPPVEVMAVVSVVFLGASVASVFAIGLGRFVTFPWTIGMTIGAALALLGAMTGVPAWHGIRRSHGRKRGRRLATIGMIGGALLFLGFGAGAFAGAVQIALRPSCEDNLHKIYAALRAYAERHDGKIPRDLEVLLREGYLDSRNCLTCPKYQVPSGSCTYQMAVSPGIDIRMDNPRVFPSSLMIVSDGAPYDSHPDGMVRTLLLDGTIQKVPFERWEHYRREQGQLWDAIRETLKTQAVQPTVPPGDSTP